MRKNIVDKILSARVRHSFDEICFFSQGRSMPRANYCLYFFLKIFDLVPKKVQADFLALVFDRGYQGGCGLLNIKTGCTGSIWSLPLMKFVSYLSYNK